VLSAGVLTAWQVADVRFQQLLLRCCATDDDSAAENIWRRQEDPGLLCQALAELAGIAGSPVQDAAAVLEDQLSSLSEMREESANTAVGRADNARKARPAVTFKAGCSS